MLSIVLPADEYDKDKKTRGEFDKKIEFVKQEIITTQIREQFLLKEISKNDILDEIKWDIGTKCHDLEKGSIEPLRFATLKFICNQGSIRTVFNAIFHAKRVNTLTIDMHLKDIDLLIDDLCVLRDNLEK